MPCRLWYSPPRDRTFGDCLHGWRHRIRAQSGRREGTEKQFQVLCQVLDLPELLQHPFFKDNEARVQHRNTLAGILKPIFAGLPTDVLNEKLIKANIPFGWVKDLQEVFQEPAAEKLILEEGMPDGSVSRRVRTVVFELVDSL